jgi:hypothetical protein
MMTLIIRYGNGNSNKKSLSHVCSTATYFSFVHSTTTTRTTAAATKEAERGGSRTGSLAKGAGSEGVGPGHDIVLERVKAWKTRNNYINIDGWDGDE